MNFFFCEAYQVLGKLTGHAEEHLGVAVGQARLGRWVPDGVYPKRADMDVQDESLAIVCSDRSKVFGDLLWIAICGFAIGDM